MARRPARDLALTILLEETRDNALSDDIARVWDSIVRSRAMVLDEITARVKDAAAPASGGGLTLVERLALARRKLSRIIVLGLGKAGLEDHQHDLKLAAEDCERAERELAQASASYGRRITRSQAGLDNLIASLPLDTGLIAYVKFDRLGRAPGEHAEWYMAMTLEAGTHRTHVVPLATAVE